MAYEYRPGSHHKTTGGKRGNPLGWENNQRANPDSLQHTGGNHPGKGRRAGPGGTDNIEPESTHDPFAGEPGGRNAPWATRHVESGGRAPGTRIGTSTPHPGQYALERDTLERSTAATNRRANAANRRAGISGSHRAPGMSDEEWANEQLRRSSARDYASTQGRYVTPAGRPYNDPYWTTGRPATLGESIGEAWSGVKGLAKAVAQSKAVRAIGWAGEGAWIGQQGYQAIHGLTPSGFRESRQEAESFAAQHRGENWATYLKNATADAARRGLIDATGIDTDKASAWISRQFSAHTTDWRNHLTETPGRPSGPSGRHSFNNGEVNVPNKPNRATRPSPPPNDLQNPFNPGSAAYYTWANGQYRAWRESQKSSQPAPTKPSGWTK